ncbi:MAG: TrmH family RNA methyltransferase [Bacteroidetes bacterium]|nr:MAG: TrmH family RNA methyltransferase [Bacteroidota bacterium]
MKKLSMEELNRLSPEEFIRSEKMPVTVVLDNIRSLNNIGSIFRTSDAFRVECIHLCGITAKPPHREIQKTALGATESVTWKYFTKTEESVQELKDAGYRIWVVEQTEGSVLLNTEDINADPKTAIILGNEVHGVQQSVVNMADICLEIPQMGTKHSLNVSVSAGIVLWSLFKEKQWE